MWQKVYAQLNENTHDTRTECLHSSLVFVRSSYVGDFFIWRETHHSYEVSSQQNE
jgi:hypothetical protein